MKYFTVAWVTSPELQLITPMKEAPNYKFFEIFQPLRHYLWML